MVGLLDVNFLVALFNPLHLNHLEAHTWFGMNSSKGWATCPLTENGFVRVMSNPATKLLDATVNEVVRRLRMFCEQQDHVFWPDAQSPLNEDWFAWQLAQGHQQITDIYLLSLSAVNDGRLVTFDRRIPLQAVPKAAKANLLAL